MLIIFIIVVVSKGKSRITSWFNQNFWNLHFVSLAIKYAIFFAFSGKKRKHALLTCLETNHLMLLESNRFSFFYCSHITYKATVKNIEPILLGLNFGLIFLLFFCLDFIINCWFYILRMLLWWVLNKLFLYIWLNLLAYYNWFKNWILILFSLDFLEFKCLIRFILVK